MAVLCFAAYFVAWHDGPYLQNDSGDYMSVASDLQGDFRIDQLHDRTAGYPLLLVLTGSVERPTRALLGVQLFLYVLGAYWLAALMQRHVSPRASLVFLTLIVLPRYVAPAGYVMTETLTQFLLVAALVSLAAWLRTDRLVYLAAAGLATAWCGITRPTYQFLAVAILAALVVLRLGLGWQRLSAKNLILAGAVLVSSSGVVIGGTALMNYVRFGYLGVTPLLGVQLATRTVPVLEKLPASDAKAREVLIGLRDEALVKRGSSHTGVLSGRDGVVELQKALGLTKAEAARYMVRLNLELIRAAPLSYLQAVAAAMGVFWLPGGNDLANAHSRAVQLAWVALDVVIFTLFAGQFLVVAGALVNDVVLRLWTRSTGESRFASSTMALYVLSGTIIAYTAVVSCTLGHGDVRFREPIDTLIPLMLVVGLSLWWQLLLRPECASDAPAVRQVIYG